MLDVYVVINAECAFGAAARAAIFAGVQPSRLTLRGLPLSGGVAPGYSQYSLPGWIVLLANGFLCRLFAVFCVGFYAVFVQCSV